MGGNYVSFVLAQVSGGANGKSASFRVVAPASSATRPGCDALYVLPSSPYKDAAASLARHHASVGLNTPHDVGQVLLGVLMTGMTGS